MCNWPPTKRCANLLRIATSIRELDNYMMASISVELTHVTSRKKICETLAMWLPLALFKKQHRCDNLRWQWDYKIGRQNAAIVKRKCRIKHCQLCNICIQCGDLIPTMSDAQAKTLETRTGNYRLLLPIIENNDQQLHD